LTKSIFAEDDKIQMHQNKEGNLSSYLHKLILARTTNISKALIELPALSPTRGQGTKLLIELKE